MDKQNNAQQIRGQLELFVRAWASGETDLIDQCVAQEPYIYFSTHYTCYTREQLKWQLKTIGIDRTTSVMNVANELSYVSGDSAVQYAAITGLFAAKDSHLAFGGTFCNKLEHRNGTWIFTEMRFELQTDDSMKSYMLDGEGHVHVEKGEGDTAFIEKWNKVNTSIGLFVDQVPGQGKHTIMAEFDAPWYLVSRNENALTDEQAIQQTFLRYCYAFDLNTPDLFDGVFSPDAAFVSNQAGTLGMKDAVNYLTIIRQASSRSFHAVRFSEACISGEKARMKATRLCPELAKVSIADNGDASACFDAGEYDLSFVKNAGVWQIDRFAYRVF